MMERRRVNQAGDRLSDVDFDGVSYWHLLNTAAGREFTAAERLYKEGMRVYVPLQLIRKRLGKSRKMVNHVPVKYAAFAGYLFVGFARGAPDWMALYKTGLVRSVVCIGDMPYRVTNAQVAGVARRQRKGEFAPDQSYRPTKKKAPDVKAGETWRINEGPLRGHYKAVQRVQDGRAQVVTWMLGKENFLWLPLDAFDRRL